LYNCMKKTLFVYFSVKGNVRMLCRFGELDVTGETLFISFIYRGCYGSVKANNKTQKAQLFGLCIFDFWLKVVEAF